MTYETLREIAIYALAISWCMFLSVVVRYLLEKYMK